MAESPGFSSESLPRASVASDEKASKSSKKKILNAKARIRKMKRDHHHKNQTGSLNIIHTNIRGFQSKTLSLQSVMKVKDADVVTINETQLVGKKKIKIPGYSTLSRNRTGVSGGGIATSFKNSL